jgi:hypothetical protein
LYEYFITDASEDVKMEEFTAGDSIELVGVSVEAAFWEKEGEDVNTTFYKIKSFFLLIFIS